MFNSVKSLNYIKAAVQTRWVKIKLYKVQQLSNLNENINIIINIGWN